MSLKKNKRSNALENEGEPTTEDVSIEQDIAMKETNEPLEVNPPIREESQMPPETGDYEQPQSDVSTMKIITTVDSPIDIKQVFWSFVTKDISMSNITESDFKFILTNLTLRLYSFIQKYPIETWDNIKFAEYDYKVEPLMNGEKIAVNENGEPIYTQKKYVKNSWDFSELLIDLEEFVYQQLTRGRQGFTFRRLTESFQVSEVNRGNEGTPTTPKKGWKLW